MTRINCVPVAELCDQHLLAEFREITRVPNQVISGKLKAHYPDQSAFYTLGKGHVKFFVDKCCYLHHRYELLTQECKRRGFNITPIFPDPLFLHVKKAYNIWVPDAAALNLNRQRICQRMPASPRWTNTAQLPEVYKFHNGEWSFRIAP